MAIDANTLFAESACFLCSGVSQAKALVLALERRWLLALDPAADTSVDALLNEARCLGCHSDASIEEMLELGLLSKIVEAL